VDEYPNLILLCPTHHRLVDKAPADFPPKLLYQWKDQHEAFVRTLRQGETFNTKRALFTYAAKLLQENRQVLRQFGPESNIAKCSPFSEVIDVWELRKIALIIPNNTKVVESFLKSRSLLSVAEWAVFSAFREHAVAFERSSYQRLDTAAQPRFPQAFGDLVGANDA
jgi:hypothetical protein